MKLDYESTEPDVRIEIVPLIDVIFCILTFFILAAVTLTRQAAINVDLPQANTGSTQMRQTLIVSVDPIGQVYVEKLPVNREQLYQSILTFRQQNPEGMMVLYASRSASYNDVVEVLDLLRSAGGDRVALATLPGESGQSPVPGQSPGQNSIPGQGSPQNPASPDLLFPPAVPSPNSASPGSGSDLFNLGQPSGSSDPNSPSLGLPGSNSPSLTSPNSLPGAGSGSSGRSNPNPAAPAPNQAN